MPSAPSRPAPALRHQLARRKPIDRLRAEAATGVDGEPLRRTLGVWHLTMISVGATLGTGILVVLGTAVPLAGPAVWISFVLAGVAALLSALSYAEMAGAVPTSGSSYSYTYATMGEGIAWVCGWCLVLEYAVSVAAVAVGASEYVDETLRVFHLHLPTVLSAPPGDGGVVNLPAAALVLVATAVLLPGARESAWVNTLMVVVKIALLVFFVAVAFTAFRAGNFEPLAPMGAAGVTAAASRLFFSYIGFDAASTAGEEAKDPRRDLPRAIIGSIALITALYILVAVAAIGARSWTSFSADEASLVRIVVDVTGQPLVALVFSVGAVVAIASVVLTVLYGQTRILLTMARDGLVPRVFGRVSRRTGTPIANTLIVGGVVTVVAALVPLGELADATSIGTLVAFALVNVSVIVLRRSQPTLERSYRVPLFPVVPVLGTLCCVLLAVFLGAGTWIAFGVWMVVGAALYLLYGRRYSTLR
ncbi:APC family permease [Curtobacterium sp. 9128]|uniref:APC family permease n=1 Tax=Curtobacterium sp. 9128 TaxID=1793722 RepID=UPI0011A2745C|nr:amino acid permease [Curtobacterium sp. 9128]